MHLQLWLASFWAWIAVSRAVSYTPSFLTLERIVKGVLGSALTPETVNCTRTDLLYHYVVCILSQNKQDSDSALYGWDPLAQTNWYPDDPPEKILVLCGQSCLLAAEQEPLQHWNAAFGSTQPMSQGAAALWSYLVGTQAVRPAVLPPWAGQGLLHPLDWFPFLLIDKSSFLIRSCSTEVFKGTWATCRKELIFRTFGALLLSKCRMVSFPQNGSNSIFHFQMLPLLYKSFSGCCIHSESVFADLPSVGMS